MIALYVGVVGRCGMSSRSGRDLSVVIAQTRLRTTIALISEPFS
jgi:hypothetical protein